MNDHKCAACGDPATRKIVRDTDINMSVCTLLKIKLGSYVCERCLNNALEMISAILHDAAVA